MPELLEVTNHSMEDELSGRVTRGFKLTYKINGATQLGVTGRIQTRLTGQYPLKAGNIETLSVRVTETPDRRSSDTKRRDEGSMRAIKRMREKREKRMEKRKRGDLTDIEDMEPDPPEPTRNSELLSTYVIDVFVPNRSLGDRATEIVQELFETARRGSQ